jgi:hypothetical protein
MIAFLDGPRRREAASSHYSCAVVGFIGKTTSRLNFIIFSDAAPPAKRRAARAARPPDSRLFWLNAFDADGSETSHVLIGTFHPGPNAIGPHFA